MSSALMNVHFAPLLSSGFPETLGKTSAAPCNPKKNDEKSITAEKTNAAAASSFLDFSKVLDPDELTLDERMISTPTMDTEFRHVKDDELLDAHLYAKQRSLQTDTNSEISNDEIKRFLASLIEFEKLFEAWKQFYNGIGTGMTNSLSVGEYIDRNGKNTRDLSYFALTSEDHEDLGARSKTAHGLFKWADITFLFIFNICKYYTLAMLREKFKRHRAQFERLKPQNKGDHLFSDASPRDRLMATLQRSMDHLSQQLKYQHKDVTDHLEKKGAKLVSYISAFPLEYCGLAHNVANRVCKCSYGMIKGVTGIYSIRKALAIQKEWKFQLQSHEQRDITNDDESDSQHVEHITPSPPFRRVRYVSFAEYLAALQKCTTLQKASQMLDNPWVFVTLAADVKLLEDLQLCDSLRQIQAKIHNYVLDHEVCLFFKDLEECEDLETVQRILKKQSINSIVLPITFDRWQSQLKDPRFKRDLTELYYFSVNKRKLHDDSTSLGNLKGLSDERKEMVDRAALTVIAQHIGLCETWDFAEVKDHFAKNLHIEFDEVTLDKEQQEALPFPPASKDDWEACHASLKFRHALAEQWVDYQSELSKRAYQRMLHAVRAKIQVEDEFLNFRLTINNVVILSSGVQLLLFWPQTALKTTTAVLELFVTKFTKLETPGTGAVNILYPLYPDVNFKVDSFIILLAEHFFAIKYKPNEYSMKGYHLYMQMRFHEFEALIHYFMAFFKEIQLWLHIRLIENCIIGLEHTPFETDVRYKDLRNDSNNAHSVFENKIRKTKELLTGLRIQDAKLAISPDPTCDPIHEFAEDLQGADFKYFPSHIMTFFENTFGMDLKQVKKEQLPKILEDFFAKSEEHWTAQYQENRFSYLKNEE